MAYTVGNGTLYACLFLASISSLSHTAQAQENTISLDDVTASCPVSANIRVSDVTAFARFSSLGTCTERLVLGEKTALPVLPSVVRIRGVSVPRGDRASQPASRAATAAYAPAMMRTARLSVGSLSSGGSLYDAYIARSAAAYRIDPLFLHAIVDTESAYDERAVSSAGARGLMQIMPATGARFGVGREALFDPAVNIDTGARLIRQLHGRYGLNFDLILGAYNAGEGAVARYGNRVPPYRETRTYVGRVMARYDTLRAQSDPLQ
jgi:soluble lytic murein transglycosylase-like protein